MMAVQIHEASTRHSMANSLLMNCNIVAASSCFDKSPLLPREQWNQAHDKRVLSSVKHAVQCLTIGCNSTCQEEVEGARIARRRGCSTGAIGLFRWTGALCKLCPYRSFGSGITSTCYPLQMCFRVDQCGLVRVTAARSKTEQSS